jgi:hypothetical protein
MLLPLLALAMMLAGCGGSTLATEVGTSPDSSINEGNLATGSPSGELLPLGSAVPDLPADNGSPADPASRSASAVLQYDGSDFLVAAGGTVEGSSLLLESSEDDPAWGMYKADGLSGRQVLSFALETRPQDLNTTYYVALGSFTDNRWHWLIETTLPEVNISFTDNEQQWISELGNLYWVVLVDGGKSLYVDRATITTGNTGGGGNPGGECTALGPIDSIDDLSIIVGNHYFIHNSDTLWIDDQGNFSQRSAFHPGMHVLVEGYESDAPVLGGGCTATLVQMLGGNGGGGEFFTIDGPVAEVNEQFFTIDGNPGIAPRMILHDAQTEFVFADGSSASWQDMLAGDFAHATGAILADGVWLAHFVIINPDNGGGGGGFVLDGIVTSIGPATISVEGGPAGLPQTVGHDDHTLFLLPDGMEGGWQDVAIGDFVHIDGQITPDGAWLADVIMVFGDNGGGGGGGGGEFITFDGVLLAVDASSLTISDNIAGQAITIEHDAQTLWLLGDGTQGDWQSIAVGSHVLVDAQLLDNNGLLALTVMEFEGPPAGG